MQIDIFNINKFIEVYECKEVKSSNLMSQHSTEPDSDGLGSYTIFGLPGTPERKLKFGYINLNDYFIHPHIFNALTSIFRAIEDLIYGEDKFYLKDGQIMRYTENMELPKSIPVGTGIGFLREIWDDIEWTKSGSRSRNMRIDILKLVSKEEIFINKWLVIPPYFRDVDMNAGKKNDRNLEYSRLINYASMLKSTSGLFEIKGSSDAHKMIQKTINEMYSYFIGFVTGVKGFVHKHVMGKSTDYSSRIVISTATVSSERVEDMEVSFQYSAVPLATLVKIFIPFIRYGVKKLVKENLQGRSFIYDYSKPDTVDRRVRLAKNWDEIISDDGIDQMVELYYNSKEHRLDPFSVEGEDGKKYPLLFLTNTSDEINISQEIDPKHIKDFTFKPMNLTHMFYKVCEDIIADKIIFITRYPVEDYHNIYPSKFNIIPCTKYNQRVINGKIYKRWPDLSQANIHNVDKFFVDTLRMFPTFLDALDADFDGDQIAVQGLYSKEAQEEAENYMNSNSIIININGSTMRTPKDTFLHAIYGLTTGPKF